MNVVGAIGTSGRTNVDARGGIIDEDLELGIWIGADDGWHIPAEDPTTRQRRLGKAPVFETSVRVPGGNVVQFAFGVATSAGRGATVVDIENQSPAPCSLAFVVRLLRPASVTLDGAVLRVDGQPSVTLARPARLWTGAERVREIVVTGGVQAGGVADWRAPGEVALLVPLPHRTQMRVVVGDEQLDPASLPDADGVARGWDLQLDRGLRTDLPDPWQEKIDAARADLLLAPPSANAIVALEDWGFDTEAAAAWAASGFRQRRRARRRRRVPDALTTARTFDHAADPAGYLAVMRQVLVDETDGEVMLLSDFPTEWLGQNLAVHDLPLRAGLLSFAIRWHAARPALLWDAPDGVVLRTPALDPSWSAAGGAGDTLLAEPPAPLLAMGTTARVEGERIDDPGSFG